MYAALGVSEVWRFDGRTLTFLVLQKNGSYGRADASATFPGLRVADVQRFLGEAQERGQGAVVLAFRDWIRSGGA